MDKAYFRVLDLFCGAGGFASGIDKNPHFETLLALDFEQAADTRFDTPSNGTNSHPFLHRSITPREAARIQSFSDSFIFLGKKTQVCKQIGNAVPPLL